MNNLGDAIRKIAQKTDQRQYATQGIVRDTDEANGVIIVEPILADIDFDNGKEDNYIRNVKVIPFVGATNKNYNLPAVGSQVIIFYLNDYEPFVAMAGETTKATTSTTNTVVQQAVNADGVDDDTIEGPFIKLIGETISIANTDALAKEKVPGIWMTNDETIIGIDNGEKLITFENDTTSLKDILIEFKDAVEAILASGQAVAGGYPVVWSNSATINQKLLNVKNNIIDLLKEK